MARKNAASSANRLVAVTIVLVTVVFAILVSQVFYSKDVSVAVMPSQPLVSTQQATVLEADTDNDGLADWEEVLWDTDPNNPDTDNDGVLDGDERAVGRDPLVAGVGHLATNKQFEVGERPEPKAATEAVAQTLMGTLMKDFQGQTADVNKERIVEEALLRAGDFVSSPQYMTADVHMVPASPESQKAYVILVSTTLRDAGVEVPGEFDALAKIAQGQKADGLRDLQTTVDYYEKNVAILRTALVPSDAVSMHIELVSAYLAYIAQLQAILAMDTDPVLGAVAVNEMMSTQQRIQASMQSFVLYMVQTDNVPTKLAEQIAALRAEAEQTGPQNTNIAP